jgi:hypothetical protein
MLRSTSCQFDLARDKEEVMNTFKRYSFVTSGFVAFYAMLGIQPTVAQPALSFDTQKTRLPYASCMQDALRTVKAMGLKIWFQKDFGVGANSSSVNALIICTKLPGAGPCNGDGAVRTITVTATAANVAGDTVNRMVSTFGHGQLIDCG